MKFDHTPGPWKYEKGDEDSGYGGRHFVSHPETQCDVTTVCETNYGEADARLIAAAPEMLEALMEISKYLFQNDKNSIGHKSAYHRMVNDLIESATEKPIEEILKIDEVE